MKKSFIYIIDWTATQGAIKIGKADNIYARYLQLKSNFGDADLLNSYWIEVPNSKVIHIESLIHVRLNKYRREITDKSEGYTEFFDISSLESLNEFCNDMGLIMRKGIEEPKIPKKKKQNKNDLNNTLRQQKIKNRIEKSVRQSQRTLKRFIKVFKYLNVEENKFFIQYIKPSEKLLINEYYRTGIPKRWLDSIVLCPEKKLKQTFFEWFKRKSHLEMVYESGRAYCSMNLLSQSSYRLRNGYISSFDCVGDYLNTFKKLRDVKESEDPAQYIYNQKYLLPYLDEIIYQIETFLKKIKSDFDIANWLNPVYEWNDTKDNCNKHGEFKLQKPSNRVLKLNIEIEKIEYILEYKMNWRIKVKDQESMILISRMVFKEGGLLKERLLYLSDEENYFKFVKFLNDLFIKDTKNIEDVITDIYYPKSISEKVYSLEDLFEEYDQF